MLLLILFVWTISCTGHNDCLYPIVVDGKYGYINNIGKEVITPQYMYASEFSEGCALVVVDTTWSSGGTYGECTYKYGYINESNKIIIDTLLYGQFEGFKGYISISPELCHNGRIKFEKKYGDSDLDVRVGYMDKRGKIIVEPIYYDGLQYSDGVAAVEGDDGWGYIDINGDVIIDLIYMEASSFSEGYAIVSSYDYIIIDKQGNICSKKIEMDIPTSELLMYPFHDGLALVKPKYYFYEHEIWKYINKQGDIGPKTNSFYFGRTEIKRFYYSASEFSEGYATVSEEKDKFHFIDTNLERVSSDYDGAFSFKEGLARVKKSKWGYINKNFELVIPYQYDFCSDFKNGMAQFSVDLGDIIIYGYINQKGEIIWQNKKITF